MDISSGGSSTVVAISDFCSWGSLFNSLSNETASSLFFKFVVNVSIILKGDWLDLLSFVYWVIFKPSYFFQGFHRYNMSGNAACIL